MKLYNQEFKKALTLGIMSGMRSTAGLVFTTLLVRGSYSPSRLVHILQKKPVRAGAAVLGATEFVIDKLPNTPPRISKGGPAARTIAGAICGAAVYRETGKSAITGAITSSLAAIASTYFFYYLRKGICEKTGIADPILGAAEDALAASAGVALLKRSK